MVAARATVSLAAPASGRVRAVAKGRTKVRAAVTVTTGATTVKKEKTRAKAAPVRRR